MTYNDYVKDYPKHCVKDLLWTRRYHIQIIGDIDREIKEVCKKHGLVVSKIDKEALEGR